MTTQYDDLGDDLGYPDIPVPHAQNATGESPSPVNSGQLPPPDSWMFDKAKESTSDMVQKENHFSLGNDLNDEVTMEKPEMNSSHNVPPETKNESDYRVMGEDEINDSLNGVHKESESENHHSSTLKEPKVEEVKPPRKKPGPKPKSDNEKNSKTSTAKNKVDNVAKNDIRNDAKPSDKHDEIYWLQIIEANPQLHYYQAEIIRLVATKKELPRVVQLVNRLMEVR